MIKTLVVGMLLGVLLLSGGVYYYFASGMAPISCRDEGHTSIEFDTEEPSAF